MFSYKDVALDDHPVIIEMFSYKDRVLPRANRDV